MIVFAEALFGGFAALLLWWGLRLLFASPETRRRWREEDEWLDWLDREGRR